MKKLLIILGICCLLCGCKDKKITYTPSDSMLQASKNTFEYGEEVKYSNLFTNKNLIIEDDTLNTLTLGENKIKIRYQLDNNNYEEEYTYQVVDTTKPLVWLSGSYSVEVGYNKDLTQKIICADNYDRNPKCYIEGSYDLNKVGNYKLKYIAEDSEGNKEIKNFTLYVKAKSNNSNSSTSTHTRTELNTVIDKYKNDKTMIGIDVSKYQGDIDWQKVKNAGVEFAMIRLGTQWYFDNDDYIIDPYFQKNIEGALANDIKVGIYFYSYAKSNEDAIKQANYVIENIKDYQITMPIAFDWECFSHFNELHISLTDLRNFSKTYQDILKSHGYTPVQYGSKNYLNAFWLPVKYDTWVAHYTYNVNKTDYAHDYVMWQVCNNGKVDGINGDVDIDVYFAK